ncbi:Ataxin-10 [Dactylellina cionopaga]|nr:Ataxin-10 [Dactylellina cionopaga]
MTQLQYLPELLLAVLFSIQASFTHPGVLSPDKEKLGDDELRAIVKRTQTSSEAREVLAFNARVWTAMTETLRSGNDELGGCEHHFDAGAGVPGAAVSSPATPVTAVPGGNVNGGVVPTQTIGSTGAATTPTKRGPNGVGEQTCTCKDRRDKMYLLPKVWELVILGRNLLATKERGQDLAAESKFEEEVRRLCEICVKHAEKESYHKVLITCLQFLNNLISGNEKRKMSLWMHLFVPGSTRLLEAAKRKAVKQYQSNPKDPSSSTPSSKVSSADVISYAKDLQLGDAPLRPPPSPSASGQQQQQQQAKLSFVTMLPTILNAKEMLPLLLIIHGSITDIDGTDPARQLMRCKMMLAAEAGIGLMAGLLMFVDAWHEIDDHIYFELMLVIFSLILLARLLKVQLGLKKTANKDPLSIDSKLWKRSCITDSSRIYSKHLRTLPTISDPGVYINYDGRLEDSAKDPAIPPPPPPLPSSQHNLQQTREPGGAGDEDGDIDEFTAEFTAALRSDLGPVGEEAAAAAAAGRKDVEGEPNQGPPEDDAATEVDIDHSEATPEIVNFLAVKVFKGQLGPAVRDMLTKIGKAMGYSGTNIGTAAATLLPSSSALLSSYRKQNSPPLTPASASERVLEITEIPTEDGRSITSVAGITIYDIELHYEGLIQLLELLMLFAEQSMGRVYLRETKCVEELIDILKCFVEYVPRTGLKDRETRKGSSGIVSGSVEGDEDDDGAGMECNDPVEFRWPLIKRTIVQLISLLVYGSKETQDEIRRVGGVLAILACFGVDEENPYIQQHATLCVKNLMEGNMENQKILRELEAREVINGEALEAAGLEAYVDKQGKVKVGTTPSGKNKKKKGKK